MRQENSLTALSTPSELAAAVGKRARRLRQARLLRQSDVALRARVSVTTLQRFEATGEAAFSAVVRIAYSLGADRGLLELFALPEAQSIEELSNAAPRQRVRHRAGRAS